MQKLAEAAVHERMTKLQEDFDRHWKKKDPWEETFPVVGSGAQNRAICVYEKRGNF
jgi:hypothetical protein